MDEREEIIQCKKSTVLIKVRKGETMKKIWNRALSYVLIAALVFSVCPTTVKKAKAATSSVSLANLGALGNLSVGAKTKTGKWWMMKVGGKKAFCMNLGYTCHTGDVYEDSSATYHSTDSGKKKLKAYIGYWYDQTMDESLKAFVMAQALFWAVEEGDTSEEKLKAVISKVKSNTGYFSTKTANQLYSSIFEKSGTFSIKVKEWKYAGSGSQRQELLVIDSGVKPEPESIVTNDFYRQRIKIQKTDEDGNPMAGTSFKISAENIDELYSYRINGTTTDADEDIASFEITTKTDADGWINLRLTYRIHTNEYFFLKDDELAAMDSDAKKAIKEEWDDKGMLYASNLSYDGAKEKMEKELEAQVKSIANRYTITETNSGNSNIVINPEYKNGKTIVVDWQKSWWRGGGNTVRLDWDEVPENPYVEEVQNHYKKVAVSVKKVDAYSKDKKAHGDATLDGAVFGIYRDKACTKKAIGFNKNGEVISDNLYVIENGKFETAYLRCGQNYYLKELRAPEGYKLNTDIQEIVLDGKNYPDLEYSPTKLELIEEEQPILGKVALQKFYSGGETGLIKPEVGAVFQVYLKNKKNYDACDDYERATLVIDENGYACSSSLYYGEYILHQVSSGGMDTEKVMDRPIKIEEDAKTLTFSMNNNIYEAYLKIIKKDGNTEKTVLKAGTSYQIYQVAADGTEKLVTQEYSDGHKRVSVDTFTTDETGQIMTVDALESGTYRIYEVDCATGYHISKPYIEVKINSEENNYESFTDSDGTTYSVATVEYTNYEAYGKLTIQKNGEQLSDFKEGNFVYEEKQLDGVQFEIYADGDVVTQDGQDDTWFQDGDLVGTITTGKGAEFTSTCGGITGYNMNADGTITINLPLGKYRVKEKQTLYGYLLPENEWNLEFTWKNKDTVSVLNATDATDENGVLGATNERAKAKLELMKEDKDSKKPVEGAMFGIYSKDDIFNADGEKIVEAGECLGELVTDKNGQACSNLDLPLMSENYEPKQEVTSGSAVTVTGGAIGVNPTLNSGDYYIREESVSDSYYLDESEILLHFEYADEKTAVIQKTITRTNVQTMVEIDKTEMAGSEEIDGCHLQITDTDGNVIVSWISGDLKSVKFTDKDLGYQNLNSKLTESKHLVIGGLKHDVDYTLTETRPADGYVTADKITFQLQESKEDNEKTLVWLKTEDGTYDQQKNHIVRMQDDTTKVAVSKTEIAGSEEIPGCELAITEKGTDTVIDSWISTADKHIIEKVLVAGKTYVLTEKRPADGYVTADRIEFTVQDTGEIQSVHMVDEKTTVQFEKTDEKEELLGGARIAVYDSTGKKVADFTTKKGKAEKLEGLFKVGETYTFKEKEVPEGYEKADDVTYTVKDTSEIQIVSMVDQKFGIIRTTTTKGFKENSDSNTSPKTGYIWIMLFLLGGAVVTGGISLYAWRRKNGKIKINKK